jgi:predicted MFS family arabinose efflux permease
MSLTPYRRVLARPGVLRLLLFATLARVPATAAGVVLTLHVVTTLRLGYAAAGLVATAATVGMAIGAPWRGRAVDRLGLRRALVPSIVAEAVVWGSAPFVGYRLLLVVAFAGGVLGLPIFTVARQSLSVLVAEEQRRTAYSLDSMGVELSFMAGPALGVVVATQVSTMVALLAVGACMVAAGLALVAFDPPTRSAQAVERVVPVEPGALAPAGGLLAEASRTEEPSRGVRAWFSPGLGAVLGATAAATIVLAGTDVGVVAVLREHGAVELTGVIFAFWGIGSMLGAMVYGALQRPISPLVLLAGLAVLTIPVGLAADPWLLAVLILPAGALCAPVITATAEEVARRVPERVRGEAMGWHGSALTIGTAVGAPLAGLAIDAAAPWAGFGLVGTVGLVLAVGGLAVQYVLSRQGRTSAQRAGRAVAAEPTTELMPESMTEPMSEPMAEPMTVCSG